jgi:HlyD family secretion protein
VQAGQPVALTFDSVSNKEYHGKVSEVSSVGTTDQGVVNFNVTVDMSDADQQVKPGMTAAASIISDELNNVLLVPNRAVRTINGQQVVYVLRNNNPTPVNVTLGKSSDTESELLSGDLKEGDPIVLNPPTNLFQQGGGPRGGFGGGGGGQDIGGAGAQSTQSSTNP